MIARGEVVWADFGAPRGSEPTKRRPCIVVQADWLTRSDLNTVLTVPLTSTTAAGRFPGNVLIPTEASGLDRDSVADVTQVGPVSREFLEPYATGTLPTYLMTEVENGVRLVLGL